MFKVLLLSLIRYLYLDCFIFNCNVCFMLILKIFFNIVGNLKIIGFEFLGLNVCFLILNFLWRQERLVLKLLVNFFIIFLFIICIRKLIKVVFILIFLFRFLVLFMSFISFVLLVNCSIVELVFLFVQKKNYIRLYVYILQYMVIKFDIKDDNDEIGGW